MVAKRITRARRNTGDLPAARFMAYKVSRDGRQDRWGEVKNLTHDQARDTTRFPLGELIDERTGQKFIWSYGLMFEFL